MIVVVFEVHLTVDSESDASLHDPGPTRSQVTYFNVNLKFSASRRHGVPSQGPGMRSSWACEYMTEPTACTPSV
jgi:hypothetical protein